MKCPECGSDEVKHARLDTLADGSWMEFGVCLSCGFRAFPQTAPASAPVPDPPRLEDIDPELADFLQAVSNKAHPLVRGVKLSSRQVAFHIRETPARESHWVGHQIPAAVDAMPGRNDPCTCGSGRKWKKCHGKA